jgi:GntR family transcriptional regulator
MTRVRRRAPVLPLRRDSHVAMHRQIAEALRAAIAAGAIAPGERIPTEPELIERYRVSRITARQAVEHLAREGLVIRKQGKGTFVAGPVVRHELLELRGIYDELVSQGIDPHTDILEFAEVVPPPRVAERLRTRARKVVFWKRLYRLRGAPFALALVHLAPCAVKVTRELATRRPAYYILENLAKVRIERADIAIRDEHAPPAVRKVLGLAPGTPVMALERVSYSADGTPREHTLYFARGDLCEFSLTVRGKLPIIRSLRASA